MILMMQFVVGCEQLYCDQCEQYEEIGDDCEVCEWVDVGCVEEFEMEVVDYVEKWVEM